MVMEPQSSLIIVVSREDFRHPVSIIRLETPPPPDDASSVPPPPHDDDAFYPPPPEVQLFQTGFSANVPYFPGFPKGSVYWQFSIPPSTSPEDLYMFPYWTSHRPKNHGSLPGIIFNLSTKKCTLIKPPPAPIYDGGYAMTLGDHIYFMVPNSNFMVPNSNSALCPCFERYDTLSQSWEHLEPLPPFHADKPFNPFSLKGRIVSYAVLDDNILFRMDSNMWAYNVSRNKWYTVKVLDNECARILGEAVVINNIIYALTVSCKSLLTLTLTSQVNDGDLVFTCDLLKEYVVPGMGEIKFKFQDAQRWRTRLVHLGKDNFCVVRTCALRHFEYHDLESQYIQLTYIEVSEKKLTVTSYSVHEFKVPYGESLDIISCFSMPDCKSSALKECTRLINPAYPAEVVTLPPELPQFLEKYSSQTNTFDKQDFEQGGSVQADTNKSSASVVYAKGNVPSNASTISAAVTGHKSRIYTIPSSATKESTLGDVAASGKGNAYEEGDSICIGNLPHNFTYIQLENELNKFGPIKRVMVHPNFIHMRECFVEFETSTSKQNAIKASKLTIGGRTVVIEEKKGTGLPRGDSNWTSGGSSGGP